MRQESNHWISSSGKGNREISNSRAMGVITLIALLFVFQVVTFTVHKIRARGEVEDVSGVAGADGKVDVGGGAVASGGADALERAGASGGAGALEGARSGAGGAVPERFGFDPNTIGQDSLQLLGFTPRQARSILNYRSKGGKFRKREDFARLYVVDSAMYASLEGYIRIPQGPQRSISPAAGGGLGPKSVAFDPKRVAGRDSGQKSGGFDPKRAAGRDSGQKSGGFDPKRAAGRDSGPKSGGFDPKRAAADIAETEIAAEAAETTAAPERDTIYGKRVERNRFVCNLNTADSAALVKLYGIGGYYAKKILDYRERLGGSFVSVRQLLEIEGFSQERFSRIERSVVAPLEDVKGFSLLNADRKALERHPYIGAYAARGVLVYLELKGKEAFRDELHLLEQLVKEKIISENNALRLREYLLYL